MKKIISIKNTPSKILFYGGIALAMFLVSSFGIQNANAAITTSLDFGSTGSDVTELQTYLATNASIYPSGLITGYFGPLTQAAVQRFQIAQGIVSSGTPQSTGFGRVGPQTMGVLNILMMGATPVTWDASPTLTYPAIQRTSNSATFTWTTNEPTQGQVYYDTSALRADEATGPRQLPYVSGSYVAGPSGQLSHSVTIQNLVPNTLYYYLTRAIDNSGNMSMTWPSTFLTNQY